jgi:hypothetical protein
MPIDPKMIITLDDDSNDEKPGLTIPAQNNPPQ